MLELLKLWINKDGLPHAHVHTALASYRLHEYLLSQQPVTKQLLDPLEKEYLVAVEQSCDADPLSPAVCQPSFVPVSVAAVVLLLCIGWNLWSVYCSVSVYCLADLAAASGLLFLLLRL